MIRLLNLNDIDAYQKLRALSLQLNPLSFGTAYEERRSKENIQEIWANAKEENYFIFGYFDENQTSKLLIGFMGCVRIPKIKMRHKMEIWGVFVHPDYREKGIGGQLLESCIEKIKRIEGVEKINLTVSSPSIGALKLYQKMGFVEFGREENSMIWEGKRITTIYMSLKWN